MALLPLPPQVDRFIRLPGSRDPLPAARGAGRHLPAAAVPRLRGDRARLLPSDPRQRRRDQRGGRGSRAALRERAQAPPPRRPDLDLGRQRHAGRAARLPVRPARDRRDPDGARLRARPHAQHRRRQGGDRRRPAATSSSRPTTRASPSASATSAATASPRSAPRTSSSTIPTRASTWWCSSCARRRATPPWWRSSRRSTAPRPIRRSSRS